MLSPIPARAGSVSPGTSSRRRRQLYCATRRSPSHAPQVTSSKPPWNQSRSCSIWAGVRSNEVASRRAHAARSSSVRDRYSTVSIVTPGRGRSSLSGGVRPLRGRRQKLRDQSADLPLSRFRRAGGNERRPGSRIGSPMSVSAADSDSHARFVVCETTWPRSAHAAQSFFAIEVGYRAHRRGDAIRMVRWALRP